MNAMPDNCDYYQLNDKYRLSKIYGKDCSVMLRNPDDEVQAIVDVCNNKIAKVCGYEGEKVTDDSRSELVKFIKTNDLSMTLSAAKDLGVSIYRPDKGKEIYLNAGELTRKLKGNISGASLTVFNYKKRQLKIRASTKGAILNLSKAAVKKVVIEENCNLVVDLRDNPYIETLIIKDGFAGNVNLSRNGVKKIEIANNCRCELNINDSMKCFDLRIADVFSGVLNINNSCFHDLDIGYYSYADIKLASNWGKRNIKIGNSFRGSLEIDSVHVPTVKIGDDCKGKVIISSKDEIHGSPRVEVADEFNGDLDLSNSKTVAHLHCGSHARGKINLLGCPSLKVARLGEHFRGQADFSESGIEYLRTGKDCQGDIILLGCDNLALIKMPNERQKNVTIDRSPIKVKNDGKNVYYTFYPRQLPREYFTPFYHDWYKKIKHFFKAKLSS